MFLFLLVIHTLYSFHVHINTSYFLHIIGGGNPSPQIQSLEDFATQLTQFCHHHDERERQKLAAAATKKRLDEGDVTAARLVGGQSRLSHSDTGNKTTTPTPFDKRIAPPLQKPTAFSKYFDQRSKQEDRRFQHEVEFTKLLVGREKLENKRLDMDTKTKTIEMLEKKLIRLEQQNKTHTDLYIRLQTRVDVLYTEL